MPFKERAALQAEVEPEEECSPDELDEESG